MHACIRAHVRLTVQRGFLAILIGKYRVDEAKILLANDKTVKISDVAYEVGYNSLSAFNTAFKKATGLTPSKFRNE